MAEHEFDVKLEFAVEEIDLFLTEFCVKYKVSPLMASSVFLARMTHLNKSYDSIDDFGKLLNDVSSKIENKELEPTNQLH